MLLGDELSPRLLLYFYNLSKREDMEKDSLGGVLDLCLEVRSLPSSDPSLYGGVESPPSRSLRHNFLRKWSISSLRF